MEAQLKELVVISRSNLNALIEAAGDNVFLNNTNVLDAAVLAEYAYEAGKLDNELSLSFDNPKSRFLNSEIKL